MRKEIVFAAALLATETLIGADPAYAGPYADDMAKCFVSASTAGDRSAVMRWMFSAIALNPDVAAMASISDEQRTSMNKDAAAVFQRLVTVSCRREVVQAIKFEGPETIQYAFTIFGQVAGREMFGNEHVAESLAGLQKYLDEAEFNKLGAEAGIKHPSSGPAR